MSTCYCLFCRSGTERQTGRHIERRFGHIRSLAAIQEKHKIIDGCYGIDRRIFLPGYLFLYSKERIDHERIQEIEDVYRVLGDSGGVMELRGSDKVFAEWLWMNRGNVGISRIHCMDGKLDVVTGPMKYFMDRIIRLDKHTKNALVRMDFLGKKNDIWLAFEFVD